MLVYCLNCSAMVNAQIQKQYNRGDPREGLTETVSFLTCPSCWEPILVVQDDYGGGIYSDPEILYPHMTKLDRNIPASISVAYSEATACFRAKAFTAAAIMCRKTLEGLCNEHGIHGKRLVSALQQLKDDGVIENQLFEWADMLRISGNEAAHNVSVTVSAEDANNLLEFTQAILEYVFTYREKYEAFKKRRAKGL